MLFQKFIKRLRSVKSQTSIRRNYLKWNKTGVDLVLVDSKNDVTVKNKTIF